MSRKNLLKIFANILLALGSVLLTWALVEFIFFKPMLPHLPSHLFNFMPREARVLGQSSKSGLLPAKGYIAIAGDSFAQGKGDWFIENGYNRDSRYHSAHLLQERFGKDVVTFGRSGADNITGFVLEPLQIMNFLKRKGLDFPAPDCLLLYFYEGNDLGDNAYFAYRWINEKCGETGSRDPQCVSGRVDELVNEHASGEARNAGDDLLFGNLVLLSLRDVVYYPLTRKIVNEDVLREPGSVNKAFVGGKVRNLPDLLQSPNVYRPQVDIDDGFEIFEQAVLAAKRHLPDTKLVMVYVPSPLSCYDIRSKEVSVSYERSRNYPADRVGPYSDAMARRVREFSESQGIPFIDTRPALRKAALKDFVHGPRDWDHLNRYGYEAFTKAVGDGLEALCPEYLKKPESFKE